MVGDLPRGRGLLVASLSLATIVYTLDSTIANVALPHMQGSLQASHEQIAWVLTSYIVVSAILTPLSGYLGRRFGLRRVLLVSVGGFTLASMACGIAGSLGEMVACRMLQGAFGAGIAPIAQAVLFSVYPRERLGFAMALFGMGVMVGPILGPTLGGWLTDEHGWRWVFFINLPVGALALAGIYASLPPDRIDRPRPLAGLGYAYLALAVGLFQLLVDRGHGQDWFASSEICVAAFGAALFAYLFVVHSLTTAHPFFDPRLFRDRNFVVGTGLMFTISLLMLSAMVLMPTYLEQLRGYPVTTVGWLLAPRGVGTLVGMFAVGRLVHRIDPRLLATVGLALLAASLWQMRGFGLDATTQQVVVSGLVQGVGLGMTFIPISTVAFMSLEPAIRAEGTAFFSLMRNLGQSLGISAVVTLLARDMQANQARLVEQLSSLDAAKWQAAGQVLGDYTAPLLAAEVQRQAAAIAYANDYAIMLVVCLVAIPPLFLLRVDGRRSSAAPAEPVLVAD